MSELIVIYTSNYKRVNVVLIKVMLHHLYNGRFYSVYGRRVAQAMYMSVCETNIGSIPTQETELLFI